MKLFRLAAAITALLLTGCASTDITIPVHTAQVLPDPSQESSAEESVPQQSSEPEGGIAERAAAILAEMTSEEKAGQLVLARYPGTDEAANAVSQYSPGGFTLFAEDTQDKTPSQLAQELADINGGSDIPLLFAVDEEGGSVVRISKFSQYREERFPAQSEVLSSGGLDGVRSDAKEKSELLGSLGFNMILAPVCDLPRTEQDYIYGRAYGTDVDDVSAAVSAAVSQYVECGVVSTLKHFPGYGDNLDTHAGISIDERPLTELEQLDLQPFRSGIAAGAPVVMVSHNIVKCVNSELPGSLAPEMYSLLRDDIGFDGVIMTDDLSMDAIGEYCGENEAAVTAFLAGADLICCTDMTSAVGALREAVDSGKITQQRLDSSVLRILEMKISFGIIK